MSMLYALLVGINDYRDVPKLAGCLNDVDHFHAHLRATCDQSALAVEVLKDGDATHGNIVRQFRAHLGQARDGDVALFQFCGHGARWASAKEFREFYPDGKDEGLVCVDSRRPGGFDLADKELAVLIAEVAAQRPHLAIVLDCCHSGSGTRGADAFTGLRPRLTDEVAMERPLASYLDGHYASLRAKQLPLSIPAASHLLLAACERTQLAQESPQDKSGVFTSTLLEVLEASGGNLSYADLFVRCRAAVRRRAFDQNPQFEAFGHFNAHSGFLGRNVTATGRRYSVYFERGGWKVECGAIHGVPTEPEKVVTLALYPEGAQTQLAGTATAVQVGAQASTLTLDFASDEALRYRAEVTSLPTAPLLVYRDPQATSAAALQSALGDDPSVSVALTDVPDGARYAWSVDDGSLWLTRSDTGLRIQGATVSDGKITEAAALLRPALKQIGQWERSLALQNARTQMDPSLVDFVFAEQLPDGQEHVFPSSEIVLDYEKRGTAWANIRGKIAARNRTAQTVHVMLAYFSTAYGIHVLRNDPIAPGDAFVTLWGSDPNDFFYLEDGVDEAIEHFMLMVSTEKVDDFLLTQDDLVLGGMAAGTRALNTVKPQNKIVHRNEWFTKRCRIRVVRQLDRVGTKASVLAKGAIVVKAHPSLTANLSLSAARSSARGGNSAPAFYQAFERAGMTLHNFASTRGDDASMLELTDIRHADTLKDHPLELAVTIPLEANEALLPVVFDGQHVLLGGDAYRDDDGTTHISIDHLPEMADQRRSLGGSLKLYFFKTCLAQSNVNQLRWLDFTAPGAPEYRQSGLADKVSAAKNILLLVHGIIGDTAGMAEGVKSCALDRRFDLVLTYDYENLSTGIADTALALKAQLAAAGLQANDGKRLTLLAHSMGGLVSRWFIEREAGNAVVDHLVMCGTPNHGSPFGQVDGARKILSLLMNVSLNFFPAAIPFTGVVLAVLNYTKKLTPTLEQMHPASEFITTLNRSADPGMPYTILAGDVDAYREPSGEFFANLLTKAGQSTMFEVLFARQANDIAVGVESILGVEGARTLAPVRRNVACHHLNYFVSDAGQAALTQVEW